MRTTVMSVAALLFVLPGSLRAQTAVGTELESGDLIRITDEWGSVQEGLLISIQDGTLRWRPGATPEATGPVIPAEDRSLETVANLERYGGERRLGWKGFGITAGSLIAAGAIFGAITYEPCEGWCIMAPSSRGEAFAWGVVLGGIIGIPVGAVIGLKVKRAVWTDADVSGAGLAPSVEFAPSGRMTVGMRLLVRN